jgi:hypothetical protein
MTPDSWVPNSLVLLDTGRLNCPTTSCRPCHRAFQLNFHRFGECVCFSWLLTECCGWVKVLNVCDCVCTYEGIWQLFYPTWNACCTWISPQDCIYKHQNTRTYMYRQTERHSGWISEVVAAHTLAHVVDTRTPLRCGWAAVGTCMHTCMCMHACLSLSFSFGENTVVFMLQLCVWPYLFFVCPLL